MNGENAISFLANLLKEYPQSSAVFKRNLIKEYLQVLALSFIYTHPKYNGLIFYGGSCLRHCFGLPRLSEDIDFVDAEKRVSLTELAADLRDCFKRELQILPSAKGQKFRVYLKFPILGKLGLSHPSESDLLFLKVEVYKGFDYCKGYQTEIKPIFKFNKSILIKTFDIQTLMATKIRAILHRKWEKTSKTGKTIASVKGRDYFDLMWFLAKGINPNYECLKEYDKLKENLLGTAAKLDSSSITIDLEGLIEDQKYVAGLGANLADILKREIETKL